MGQTDERTAQLEEGLMDVRPALVADDQAAEPPQPGQRALHHPAVAAQPLAALHSFARDAAPDAASPHGGPTARDVIGLVGVQLVRALARAPLGPLDRRDAVEQLLEDAWGRPIGRGQPHRERETVALDHNMALRARFAAIRWIRPGVCAPLL